MDRTEMMAVVGSLAILIAISGCITGSLVWNTPTVEFEDCRWSEEGIATCTGEWVADGLPRPSPSMYAISDWSDASWVTSTNYRIGGYSCSNNAMCDPYDEHSKGIDLFCYIPQAYPAPPEANKCRWEVPSKAACISGNGKAGTVVASSDMPARMMGCKFPVGTKLDFDKVHINLKNGDFSPVIEPMTPPSPPPEDEAPVTGDVVYSKTIFDIIMDFIQSIIQGIRSLV